LCITLNEVIDLATFLTALDVERGLLAMVGG
jgi:hypothetical protein